MTVEVLVNPGGGSADEKRREALCAALSAAGIDAKLVEVEGEDLADHAAKVAKRGDKLLVAAGGDGTMSAVAGALAGTGTAMGIMPMGTLNHLARDLGLPTDLDAAARVIADGQRRRIDLAEVNGRLFVNNSAIGLYPLMVVDRDSQQHRLGRSKRLAMLVASLRTLMNFHDQRLTLRVNGEEEGRLDTPLLFVGNNRYALAFPSAGRRETLDDGRLCVLVLRKKGAWGLIAATLRALLGIEREDDMIELADVTRLEVGSRSAGLTVSLDGETARLDAPLRYSIRPGALDVVAPVSGHSGSSAPRVFHSE